MFYADSVPSFIEEGFVRVDPDHLQFAEISIWTHYGFNGTDIFEYPPALLAARRNTPSYPVAWSVTDGWIDLRSLAEVKAAKTEEINVERERRGILPITFQGIEWDADELSQRNISAWMASIAAGVAIPTGFVWRATDNTNHAADADFVNGLGAAITLRGTVLYQTSWGKKAAVNALTTVDAVKAYDVTAGW